LKFEQLRLLEAVKTTIIAVQSVQDDYRFLKWSRLWLHNVDRSIKSAERLEDWSSPGGKCAKATIEYAKWEKEKNPQYVLIHEKLCRQYCRDTVQATCDNWRLSLNLEEFIPDLKKYPEEGQKTEFEVDGIFKISPKERRERLKKLNFCCEICGVHATKAKSKGLVSDHDHKTGLFRSIICGNCNSMLGFAHDKPEVLRKGARYLLKYRKLHKQEK